MTHRYEKLIFWQKSMDLVEIIYKITNNFPQNEQFGLTLQMRRCSVSIPSNIAEGSKRNSDKDFYHFLTISFGSGAELETQLQIAKRLNFINEKEYQEINSLLSEIMKMINKFRSTLK